MSAKSLQTLLSSGPVVGGGSASNSPEPSNMDIDIVDSVFEKLKILFPVGAPKSEVEGTHKAEWLKTMAVQGVRSQEHVQLGLNRARCEAGDRKFWPSPRQFCTWCLPCAHDAGVPEVSLAYREALQFYHCTARHNWSHELVYLAVRETGTWLFSRGSEKEVLAVFTRNYTMLIRRFMAGEHVDVELPAALTVKASVPTESVKAKSFIAQLRRKYGLGGQVNAHIR